MNTALDLNQLSRKIRQDSLQDGLAEIILGLLLGAASVMMEEDGSVIPFLFFMLFGARVASALRRYLIMPRIGYYELPEKDAAEQARNRAFMNRIILGIGISLLVLFLTTLVLSGDIRNAARWYRWMPLPFGLAAAAGLVALARWSGLVRYDFLAVYVTICGLVFTIQPFAWKLEGMSRFCLALSLMSLAFGAFLLARFLLHHPVLPPSESDLNP